MKVSQKRPITLRIFLFGKWGLFLCMCVKVCVVLNFSMFVCVLLVTRTYICMFAYMLAYLFTYIHIFPLSVFGKEGSVIR